MFKSDIIYFARGSKNYLQQKTGKCNIKVQCNSKDVSFKRLFWVRLASFL